MNKLENDREQLNFNAKENENDFYRVEDEDIINCLSFSLNEIKKIAEKEEETNGNSTFNRSVGIKNIKTFYPKTSYFQFEISRNN